jgi:DNA polymerase-3 subunit delta
MNVQDLMYTFANQTPSPVYLFCPGKAPRAKMASFEPLLAERAIDTIIEATVDPANKDFCFASFYADETPVGNIVMDAQTLPFLAERRVVLVRNAEKYNTESAAGAMLHYLSSPNESTVLLLFANKIDKRTKFYKAAAKVGEIIECAALNESETLQWIKSEVAQRGKTIDMDAARALLDRTGTHLSDVDNALNLVVNYLGDDSANIDAESVVASCADVAEEEVWALTDAIAVSQPGVALKALQNLIDLGKHPDELIGTVNWLLKSAYAVAIAEGQPNISRFVAQKVEPLTRKLGVVKLRAAFALCTETQFMMRNTGVDSELALELLVVKLAAPIARRKSA